VTENPEYWSDRLIVRVRPGVVPVPTDDGPPALRAPGLRSDAADRLAEALRSWRVSHITPAIDPPPLNRALAAALGLDRYYVIHVPDSTDVCAMAKDVARHSDLIESAEADPVGRVHTADFPDWRLWGLNNLGQTIQGQAGLIDADIDAVQAWWLATGSPSIIVAILDTGVSQSHPNTAGIQVPGFSTDPNTSSTDDNGTPISHGTICAGLAAGARIAANQYAGVAWGARVMPVKVASAGGTTGGTWLSNGITGAVDRGANILSMSLGISPSTLVATACEYAADEGALLVASSGNTPGAEIRYPAALPMVMCVGATDNRDQAAIFQTTGPAMDVVAPGVSIWSCVDENPAAGGRGWNTFAYDNGTSMAAPQVAGLGALIMSAVPGISAARVRQLIETTVDDLGPPGWDPVFGWGRVNANRAIRAALNLSACEADWNNDGQVQPQDVAMYLNDWGLDVANGTLNCDLDHNGITEPADVSLFLHYWFSQASGSC
jgi:subtilisin family serine protease